PGVGGYPGGRRAPVRPGPDARVRGRRRRRVRDALGRRSRRAALPRGGARRGLTPAGRRLPSPAAPPSAMIEPRSRRRQRRKRVMTIGISGASGQLGRGVADKLLERVDPSELVLVTRTPEALDAYAARGVSVRRGDFDEPDSLREAYRGVDRLLLISGADVGRRVAQHSAAVDAAKDAGAS